MPSAEKTARSLREINYGFQFANSALIEIAFNLDQLRPIMSAYLGGTSVVPLLICEQQAM